MKKFSALCTASLLSCAAVSCAFAATQDEFLTYIRGKDIARERVNETRANGYSESVPVAVLLSYRTPDVTVRYAIKSSMWSTDKAVKSEIRVNYCLAGKEGYEPKSFNITADGKMKSYPVTHYEYKEQPLDKGLLVKHPKFYIFGLDISKKNKKRIAFKNLQAITVTTKNGTVVPILSKNEHEKRDLFVNALKHVRYFNSMK